MNIAQRIALTSLVPAVAGAMTLTGSAQASGYEVASSTAHHTRLWTQVPGGRNGYADIRHTYTAVGHGYYKGKLTGTLHHYHAPKNRYVVVMFRVDGKLGGISRVTKSTVSFTKSYSHFKKVSARICLHRSGVPIHLNSGVSYCGPWWG
ncbi:hypothetical protein ACWEQ2_20690 [Streptomyces sp. NPDC004096]|uniref:hypothetical protein n=1 Tax=unclassified Streptomyces TaxID=2593676 RepID=UPI0033B65F70